MARGGTMILPKAGCRKSALTGSNVFFAKRSQMGNVIGDW